MEIMKIYLWSHSFIRSLENVNINCNKCKIVVNGFVELNEEVKFLREPSLSATSTWCVRRSVRDAENQKIVLIKKQV
jgi:hypothetical protein